MLLKYNKTVGKKSLKTILFILTRLHSTQLLNLENLDNYEKTVSGVKKLEYFNFSEITLVIFTYFFAASSFFLISCSLFCSAIVSLFSTRAATSVLRTSTVDSTDCFTSNGRIF